MPRVHFALRRCDQSINQIVGLDPKAAPARNFDVPFAPFVLGELIAQLGRTTRRERHHFVGEMGIVVGLFRITQRA